MRLKATRTSLQAQKAGGGGGGGGGIVRANITYSQSSVYPGNAAATNAGMTNGVSDEATQTATNTTVQPQGEWIQMDLQGVFAVTTVTIGTQGATLAGGWGSNANYTNAALLQHSTDGTNWTTERTISGLTGNSIANLTVSFTARYIRIFRVGNWNVVTEFYAS